MSDHSFPEWYKERMPRAAKPHKCCECGGTIEPGEVYLVAAGFWNGELESFKTCVDCEAIRKKITDSLGPNHDLGDRPGFGEVYDHCVEMRDTAPQMVEAMAEVCRKRGSKRRLEYLTRLMKGEFDDC